MQINIKKLTETHSLCVVTTRKGYSYACSWAVEKDETENVISPTVDQVKEAWKENRNSFDRFNGVYMY